MIFSILLQAPLAADTVGSQINTLPVVSNASAFSMWEIIQKGGLIMIPIGFLFVGLTKNFFFKASVICPISPDVLISFAIKTSLYSKTKISLLFNLFFIF